MISSDIMRGYHDIIICLLLSEGDNYGYEISSQIERRCKGKYQIKEATLYSALNRLEKNGCILSYDGAETFGRPRTYYRLSSVGKQFLKEKAIEWNDTQEVINEFFKEATTILGFILPISIGVALIIGNHDLFDFGYYF